MTTPIAHTPLGPPLVLPTKAQSRRALILWTSIIFGLLGLQISLCVVGVVVATRTNPPVVKDYYSKAVHWDQRNRPPAADAAGAKTTEHAAGESRP